MKVDSIDQSITLSRPTTRRNSSARAASGADADDEAAAEDDAADADMTGRPRARQVPAVVARAEKPSVSRGPRGIIHVSRQNKQEAHTYAHAYGPVGWTKARLLLSVGPKTAKSRKTKTVAPVLIPPRMWRWAPLCVCAVVG